MNSGKLKELHDEKSGADQRLKDALSAMEALLRPACNKAIEAHNASLSGGSYRVKPEDFSISFYEDCEKFALGVKLLDSRGCEPDEDFWSDVPTINGNLKPFMDDALRDANLDVAFGTIEIPVWYHPK